MRSGWMPRGVGLFRAHSPNLGFAICSTFGGRNASSCATWAVGAHPAFGSATDRVKSFPIRFSTSSTSSSCTRQTTRSGIARLPQ